VYGGNARESEPVFQKLQGFFAVSNERFGPVITH